PAAAIVHHRPRHSRRVPPHLRLVTRHALLTYARKHWPGWQLPLLGGIIRLETLARRLGGWWRNELEAERTFAELDRMVCDLVAGEVEQARQRLVRVVRQEEARGVAAPVDRHSQPQSGRPAGVVPVQRPGVPAAGHAGAGR